MTPEEVIKVKTIIEAAYPNAKNLNNKESDLLYISLFGEYELTPMLVAVKEHIKTSTYPPTIADLFRRYDGSTTTKHYAIIETMQAAGYFKDQTEIAKAIMWIGDNVIPDWFKRDMQRYQLKLTSQPMGLLK